MPTTGPLWVCEVKIVMLAKSVLWRSQTPWRIAREVGRSMPTRSSVTKMNGVPAESFSLINHKSNNYRQSPVGVLIFYF